MTLRHGRIRARVTSCLIIASLVLASVVSLISYPVGAQDETLRIGCQDEPKTRNILEAPDRWTHQVLDPIYDIVAKFHNETGVMLPYILKGTDANGDGVFEDTEYGVFATHLGLPLEVTAFYDFNGVLFHDGFQATVYDLLYSYHVYALDPRVNHLDVLKDKNNLPGSNYSTTRWMNLWELKSFDPSSDWAITIKDYSDPSYNVSLRAAVRFKMQGLYWGFFKHTLSQRLLPAHLWEGTGCIYDRFNQTFKCDIHKNKDGSPMDSFGIAYDGINGVPPTHPNAFDFALAESWDLPDEYVIGTGPFTFDRWVVGQYTSLKRNEEYYVGEPYLHKPYIDGMLFKVFKTTQTAVYALRVGDIDYVAWSIPPAFVSELVADTNIDVFFTSKKGYAGLYYNLRYETFGYPDNNPSLGDTGLNFRLAVAHLIDRSTMVTVLLQNYGLVADSHVNPILTGWYNASLPQYPYDPAAADALLDTYDVWDESTDGPCQVPSGAGCRSLPGLGTNLIEIYVPNADYDPIMAASGSLLAQAMQSAGINVVSKPTSFGEIIQRIDARDFQMFMLELDISTEPPEHLHAGFYSRNSAAGQNYPGYKSDEFDNSILIARQELDDVTRMSLIRDSQSFLAYDKPCDPMFFRTNNEAYRSDRFINWTVGPGDSIYHYWSWIGIIPVGALNQQPTVSITSLIDGETVGGVIDINGTASDPDGDQDLALVEVRIDLGTWMTAVGTTNWTYIADTTSLSDGVHTIGARSFDGIEYSDVDTVTVIVSNNDAPSVTIQSPSVDETIGGTYGVGGTASDPDGDDQLVEVQVRVDESGWSIAEGTVNWHFDLNTTLYANGEHTIYARAFDGLAYSPTDSVRAIIYNNHPPTITETSLIPGDTLSGVVLIEGSASDPDGDSEIARVEIRIDDGNWEEVNGTDSWSFEMDTTALSNGEHNLSIRAYDGDLYSDIEVIAFEVKNVEDDLTWLWILILVLVLVVILALIFILRRRRKEEPDLSPEVRLQTEEPDSTLPSWEHNR